MNDFAAHPQAYGPEAEPESADPAAERAERKARHLRQLKKLTEIGMEVACDLRPRREPEPAVEIARATERQDGTAEPAAASAPEPLDPCRMALAFARVSREIRLTQIRETEVADDIGPRPAPAPRDRIARDKPPPDPAGQRAPDQPPPALLKENVWALVDHAITEDGPEEEQEELWAEARAKLEDEIDWDIEERSFGEIAVRIVRDLGFPSSFAYNYSTNLWYGPATPKTAEERAEARRRRKAGIGADIDIAAEPATAVTPPDPPPQRRAIVSGPDPP